MRRGIASTLTVTALLLGAAATAPAASADEWLYVLSSQDMRVLPGKADAGRVVLRGDIAAIQFTDRPDRRSSATSTRSVLRDFGWSPSSADLSGKAPNAAVAIDGDLTQTVEIRSARVTKDKVILVVRGLDGPLTKDSGAGAVFIDDASGTQTTTVAGSVTAASDYNPSAPSISVQFVDAGVVMWSGTLTPAAPSATVPTSTSGGTTISGTLRASFDPRNTEVAFSGTVTDSSGASPVSAVLGQWSAN